MMSSVSIMLLIQMPDSWFNLRILIEQTLWVSYDLRNCLEEKQLSLSHKVAVAVCFLNSSELFIKHNCRQSTVDSWQGYGDLKAHYFVEMFYTT